MIHRPDKFQIIVAECLFVDLHGGMKLCPRRPQSYPQPLISLHLSNNLFC